MPEESLIHVQFDTRRAWNIKVTQIPCGCPLKTSSNRILAAANQAPKAPSGCLSYHTGMSGTLKSFNYDASGCYRYKLSYF
jgi:hypothetical protein